MEKSEKANVKGATAAGLFLERPAVSGWKRAIHLSQIVRKDVVLNEKEKRSPVLASGLRNQQAPVINPKESTIGVDFNSG